MQKCRKICSFRFANFFSKKKERKKKAPEVSAEIPRTLYVAHTTFLANHWKIHVQTQYFVS